jgi:AcrR family transcriptional regulator
MTRARSAARERILATADTLFYGEGVRAVGVDRVVEESKVARVTFYRHFPSKNDLVVAYIDGRLESRRPG